MPESDQVLSQSEIDALLSGDPIQADPAPESPPAAVAQPAAPAAAAAPAAPVSTGASSANIAYITERVVRLEVTVSQMGGSGQGSAQLEATVGQLQTSLLELTTQLQTISAGLQGTVGYAAHENFVCTTCSSPGLVAAKLNCTSCGSENWWGWYPPVEA
jgi:hypothetical protein